MYLPVKCLWMDSQRHCHTQDTRRWWVSYPWHPTSPRHTPVVSSDGPEPPEQSLITPHHSPDCSDLSLCIFKPSAVSLNPSALSPNRIWCNWPFQSPTTSPKPVWQFSVMLTLSDLVLCAISLQPLPNALGSFPESSLILSDWYLAQTTSPKPYGPSSVISTYADLSEPISTLIHYSDTYGSLCHVYWSMVTLTKPTQPYVIHFGFPKPCLAFPNLTQHLSSVIVIPVPIRISYPLHWTLSVYLGLIHTIWLPSTV